jgi:hypothetical protein
MDAFVIDSFMAAFLNFILSPARLPSISAFQVYNARVSASRRLPEQNQLSVLVATILLAYASLPYIALPQRELDLPLPGIVFTIRVGVETAVGLLVAGLSGSGTYWILKRHPEARGRQIYQHLILPGLAALVIGLPLSDLKISPAWWMVFIAGGIVLLFVIIAEYITLDVDDIRQPVAAGFLTAVAYAVFLLLVIENFSTGTRLFILLPVIFGATWLVTLRVLHERLGGKWMFSQATVVALITTQLAAAFHYLPLSRLTAGLLVVGPAFALAQLLENLSQGQRLSQAAVEPVVSFGIIFAIALWIQ